MAEPDRTEMEKLKVKFDKRLTAQQISDIIEDFKRDSLPEIEDREAYSKANNPTILSRTYPVGAPTNRIVVPYGRRILSLITGYMFLPGLITYESENEGYLKQLQEIFDVNEEPMETYRIGWQTSLHGQGYELLYNEGLREEPTLIDNQPGYLDTEARFAKVPMTETIPIWDFDIIPNLRAVIRFYTVEAEKTEYISVYYDDVKEDWVRAQDNSPMTKVGEQSHGYSKPPLVVYENNEDLMGDFAAVQSLIDAYDILMSDSMNEFDRFAQAYLVAKGFTITADDVEKLKHKRAFSLLSKDDSIEFLTKQIEVEFIRYIGEQLRAEIHRGSGIPNLDDYKWGGGTSGETIDKFIYLMELFTGAKEAAFKRGLKERIRIITEYAQLDGDPDEIEIIMDRNEPDKSMLMAELMEKYAGHVSEETLLDNFADFVADPKAELAKLKAEQEAKMQVDLDMFAERAKVAGPPEEKEDAVRKEEEEA